VSSENTPDIPNAKSEDKHEGERKEAVNALANTLERIRQEKIEEERRKILDGTYPSRVVQGRQNKHIESTVEFEQKRRQMQKDSPGSEPSIINTDVDAQSLVDTYKGTGDVYFVRSSPYPRENITSKTIIGKSWWKEGRKYVDTSMFTISYSSTGVHIIPISEHGRK